MISFGESSMNYQEECLFGSCCVIYSTDVLNLFDLISIYLWNIFIYFFMHNLPIDETGVLHLPTIIAWWPVGEFISNRTCFTTLGSPVQRHTSRLEAFALWLCEWEESGTKGYTIFWREKEKISVSHKNDRRAEKNGEKESKTKKNS